VRICSDGDEEKKRDSSPESRNNIGTESRCKQHISIDFFLDHQASINSNEKITTMSSLKFSQLDENLFQGIIVVSVDPKKSSKQWLQLIVDNAENRSSHEFRPIYECSGITLEFDDVIDKSIGLCSSIQCHCAILDNKYYTTKIYLIELDEPKLFPEGFYDFIHGIVILADPNDANCLNGLEKWSQYIELMENCAIKIVASENCTNNSVVSKIDVQNYSVTKGFELIDMLPNDLNTEIDHNRGEKQKKNHHDEEEEDDDEFDDDDDNSNDIEDNIDKKSKSYERLYKAIQAYVWPEMNYKDKHSKSNSTKRKTDALMKNINRLSLKDSKPNIEKLVHSRSNVSTSESPIINQIDSDQPKTGSEEISEKDVDDFQEIFNKFNELKESIKTRGWREEKLC
ncbi:hypothetical protein SSS_00602, partial [Sarcoptes scabiei]